MIFIEFGWFDNFMLCVTDDCDTKKNIKHKHIWVNN